MVSACTPTEDNIIEKTIKDVNIVSLEINIAAPFNKILIFEKE
jgi:hypothetical protein